MNQVAYQVRAYPGFSSIKQPEVFSATPWIGCLSISGLPPAVSLPLHIHMPGLRDVL